MSDNTRQTAVAQLSDITQVGSVRAQRLYGAGFESPEAVSNADPAVLAEAMESNMATGETVRNAASEMVDDTALVRSSGRFESRPTRVAIVWGDESTEPFARKTQTMLVKQALELADIGLDNIEVGLKTSDDSAEIVSEVVDGAVRAGAMCSVQRFSPDWDSFEESEDWTAMFTDLERRLTKWADEVLVVRADDYTSSFLERVSDIDTPVNVFLGAGKELPMETLDEAYESPKETASEPEPAVAAEPAPDDDARPAEEAAAVAGDDVDWSTAKHAEEAHQ
ncbi:hypothetical protein [Halosegnis longus]|uniref:hypothetical protein n=1 Tax=Halosegnis longus TaxID=2216012 RepID=UPI00129DC7C8|nr:hypothetical protein [Halosegnis longus]